LDEVTLPHVWQPYEKAGLETRLKSHFIRLGQAPT
jgi:hypothetical protein